MPGKWLNQTEYARHRGVSPPAVNYAIKKGRIAGAVRADGKIDPDIADELWEKNSIPLQPGQKQGRPPKVNEKVVKRLNDLEIGEGGAGTMVAHKTLEAKFKAKLARLEYEERTGKVVDAEKVHKAAFKLARVTRDAMLAIPDRLAAELAGLTDPFVIHSKMMSEIRGAIEQVNAAIADAEQAELEVDTAAEAEDDGHLFDDEELDGDE